MDFSQNFFQLFALPEQFDIDLKRLSSCYQDLQKTLHPDRFANASEGERRLSLQKAGQVNNGFQTLKDPLARAKYLLELQGVIACNEEVTIRDPEFLEQQMELREQLAEISHAADPLDKLLVFMSELDQAVLNKVAAIAGLFSSASPSDLEVCSQRIHQLQFLYKVRQEAEILEEELM